MADPAVQRLISTLLYQRLLALETESGEHELSEQVKKVVEFAAPILAHVPDSLPEFTLHDAEHCARLVDLIPLFTPRRAIDHLNAVEIAILLMSAYLHDIGMACSREERIKIVAEDHDFLAYSAGCGPFSADQLLAQHEEDRRFGEFLRDRHARRAAAIVTQLAAENIFTWRGTSFSRWIIAICESHELPAVELKNPTRWPRDALVRNVRINVQYLAVLLRLGDILDLAPERAPRVLLSFVNPRTPKSLEQWQKHRSMIGWDVTPEHVRLDAECSNPTCERAVREYVDAIETERRDCLLLVSSYRDVIGATYGLDLTEPITKDGIHSDGTYLYSDLRFQVDYRRVLELLMGESLYGFPELALREILQNSADALRTRSLLERREGNQFTPRVSITLAPNHLLIEDNGIGMDQHIVEDYFVQVGRSYYQSTEFRSLGLDVDTTGEFGVGILSVFMVAEGFEVESRRLPSDPLHPPMPVRCFVHNAFDYFVQIPTTRKEIGTRLDLHLKEGHPFRDDDLPDTIRRIAPALEFPVVVRTSFGEVIVEPQFPHDSPDLFETRFRVDLPCDTEPLLKGSSGYIAIGGLDHKSSGTMAQDGFAIAPVRFGDRRYLIDFLFPEWTTAFVCMNLRGPGRLGLRPDRSDIVWDSRARALSSAIERMIEGSYDAHLREKQAALPHLDYCEYVDSLLEEGSLTAKTHLGFALPPAVRDLFLNRVPLPVVAQDGQLTRVLGKDLLEYEALAIVGLADCDNPALLAKLSAEITDLIGRPVPLLVQGLNGHYSRSNLFHQIFGDPSTFIVTSFPGVVADVLVRANDRGVITVLDGKMQIADRVLAATGCPLLVHRASPTFIGDPVFNGEHPVLKPFLDGSHQPKDDHCKQALLAFSDLVEAVLHSVSDRFPPSRWMKSKWASMRLQRYDAINPFLMGYFAAHPDELNRFQEAVETAWALAHGAGALSAEMSCHQLGLGDFPWFWSRESIDDIRGVGEPPKP